MSKRNFVDTPRMKPEVSRIFDDLEAWLDHCRFNLLKFDPADLYRSREYKDFVRFNQNHRKFKKDFKAK